MPESPHTPMPFSKKKRKDPDCTAFVVFWPRCSYILNLLPQSGHPVLKPSPQTSVKPLANLFILVHFTPAVSSPLTACHVDEKVSVLFVVMDLWVVTLLTTRTRWKAVHFALVDEGQIRTHPRLVTIHVLERVLLHVLPLHVHLFISDRVPPDIEQSVYILASTYEKGSQTETATVLGYDEFDGFRVTVTNR